MHRGTQDGSLEGLLFTHFLYWTINLDQILALLIFSSWWGSSWPNNFNLWLEFVYVCCSMCAYCLLFHFLHSLFSLMMEFLFWFFISYSSSTIEINRFTWIGSTHCGWFNGKWLLIVFFCLNFHEKVFGGHYWPSLIDLAQFILFYIIFQVQIEFLKMIWLEVCLIF